ncbi:MAG: single-stranded-DNA-specific exonuclease RecJ [Candidatus Pacebacteria bacterium]|nr:single-stranded-DNA-specific exonuclease RecJ [Candidatus Paceibacterota bacterium]MCD8528203.1 single-stranded-DNA-specific exonuclease RecJ [Candidatus Paceibacterota bacterium]MCD8563842.1 single-stranded-DNA-specific exonuclease RecJ [Candidatus Paceibacterota bacterium]
MAKQSDIPHIPLDVQNALGDLHPLQKILLFRRGITTYEAAQAFLEPSYEHHVHDPFLLPDIDQAVARICTALERNEKIALYADFDADGIPGAVILHDIFKKLTHENLVIYIPHRHEEGYGVHMPALKQLHKDGVSLIITIDVGITYASEIAWAQENGMDVIVTDHHEPQDIIPPAHAVINPKLNAYPDPMICGAAVAWKLGCALIATLRTNNDTRVQDIPEGWEKWLLDMVGIATISDLVPLIHENRALAHYGLHVLRKNKRPSLRALFQELRLGTQTLTEEDIAFSVTPRLNAASRMAHPRDAFAFLIAENREIAHMHVTHLGTLNDARKKLVASIVKKAHAKLRARNDLPPIIVIGDPNWNTGVAGLVATKIAEHYERPAFVWSKEGDTIKGSCRGYNGISVVELMEHATEHTFLQYGGHSGAGGFSVDLEKVHTLEQSLTASYESIYPNGFDGEIVAGHHIDTHLTLDAVTMETYRIIESCAPYGMANPKPTFLFEHITIDSVRMFGKTKEHLEIIVRDDTHPKGVKAIAFYAHTETFTETVLEGRTCSLVAQFDYSIFRGKSELRLKIVDIV